MTEREKMQYGEWYDANFDQELIALRDRAEDLCFDFNHTPPRDKATRAKILRQLLPRMAENVTILAPLYTDYGTNCTIGEGSFINHGAYLMDGATITIGDNCWLGGDVKILPGITIGEGSVIGAGSIVTHDIPPHVIAAGNPCRVLRPCKS